MTSTMLLLALTLVVLVAGVAVWSSGSDRARLAASRARAVFRTDSVPPWRRALDRAARGTPVGRSVEERLRRAGRELLAGDVIASVLLAAVLVVVLLQTLIATPVAVVVAVGGLFGANKFLDNLVEKRRQQFAAQLPDLARIMANGAAAGMAISNALILAAKELESPAGELLQEAVQQMAIGQSLAGAMAHLQDRVPSRELGILVNTLIIQQRSGGDVIEALREMSVNLEVRRDLKREVDTVMSGVKFTAYAVMGMGIGTLFLLEGISSGTLRRMTSGLAGQIVIALAAMLFTAGFISVRRLSRVDV